MPRHNVHYRALIFRFTVRTMLPVKHPHGQMRR